MKLILSLIMNYMVRCFSWVAAASIAGCSAVWITSHKGTDVKTTSFLPFLFLFFYMPSLTLNADGTCTVAGMMARSFAPSASNHLNVVSLDEIAKICLLYAREHYWLALEPEPGSDGGEAAPERCRLEEGGLSSDQPTTFFLAGFGCSLDPSGSPVAEGCSPAPLGARATVEGITSVTHVGNSSVSFHVDVYLHPSGETSMRRRLGQYTMTRVQVDKTSRKAAPLEPRLKKQLDMSYAAMKSSVVEQELSSRVLPRLDVANILKCAEAQLEACVEGSGARRVAAVAPAPHGEGWGAASSYRRRHHLRESDIDYNLHFNHHRMMELVSDTFRGALGDDRCILSRLVPKGQSYIVSDLLIRQFRIDYVKEVPMSMDGVEIQVFVPTPEDEDVIRAHAEEHTFQHTVKVMFVCRGLPSLESSDGAYPAVVGFLGVSCGKGIVCGDTAWNQILCSAPHQKVLEWNDCKHFFLFSSPVGGLRRDALAHYGGFTLTYTRCESRPVVFHSSLRITRMFRFTVPALKKLTPLGQRVLVKRTAAAKQTKAGILIPEQGTIVAVAAGTKDWTPATKVNDTVLLPEYGGSSVKVDGEEFFLYEESMLLGFVLSGPQFFLIIILILFLKHYLVQSSEMRPACVRTGNGSVGYWNEELCGGVCVICLKMPADGSYVVKDIVARAFVPMNHTQVNVIAVDAIARLSLLYAFENGWLTVRCSRGGQPTPDALPPTTPPFDSVCTSAFDDVCTSAFDAVCTSAFDAVCTDIELIEKTPEFGASPVSSNVVAESEWSVSDVTHDTLSLTCNLFTYNDEGDFMRRCVARLGTTVRYRSIGAERTLNGMPAEVFQPIQEARASSGVSEQELSSRVLPRLDVANILKCAEAQLEACVEGSGARRVAAVAPAPHGEGWGAASSYRRRHHLRESDIDYNLHFNHHRMMELVSDTFRGALGDDRCILSRLVPKGQSYIVSDLLIRQFRIDYVKEVPMSMDGVEIQVFVATPEDEDVIRAHAEEHTFQHTVKVMFVCRGLPSLESSDGAYPAVVGFLGVSCGKGIVCGDTAWNQILCSAPHQKVLEWNDCKHFFLFSSPVFAARCPRASANRGNLHLRIIFLSLSYVSFLFFVLPFLLMCRCFIMVQMTVSADGTATVKGFMARAFLAMNHLQIDVHAINSIGNNCISYAEEHNWLKPEKNEAVDDLAFFVVGIESSLKTPSTGMRQHIIPTSLHIMGVVSLSFVGSSSIGLHVELFSYGEDDEGDKKPVGGFNITCVAMSKKLRKPVPISPEHIELLKGAIDAKKAQLSEEEFQSHILSRLNVKEILSAADAVVKNSVDGNFARRLLATDELPGNEVSSYRRRHHLRESDIDYNLHFNQQRMMQLVMDTFRGAAGDDRCILSRIVPKGQSYIVSDLLIRQFRIDYVKEVPMSMDGVEIQVFVPTPEDEDVIRAHAEEHTFQHTVKVMFVCRGLPSLESSDGAYPASVGVLTPEESIGFAGEMSIAPLVVVLPFLSLLTLI
eukprot:gene9190-6467_t